MGVFTVAWSCFICVYRDDHARLWTTGVQWTVIQKNADVLAGFYTSPESLNECGAVDVLYGFKV